MNWAGGHQRSNYATAAASRTAGGSPASRASPVDSWVADPLNLVTTARQARTWFNVGDCTYTKVLKTKLSYFMACRRLRDDGAEELEFGPTNPRHESMVKRQAPHRLTVATVPGPWVTEPQEKRGGASGGVGNC